MAALNPAAPVPARIPPAGTVRVRRLEGLFGTFSQVPW